MNNKWIAECCSWLREHVEDAGAGGYVVGVSGGIDSAVAVKLAIMAVGRENVFALVMPCGNSKGQQYSTRLAENYLKNLRVAYARRDIKRAVDVFEEMEGGLSEVASGNTAARVRMTLLYLKASKLNYLVLGTGNKTELALGYFTKYGDGGVDVLPLGGLLKRDVYRLAHSLRVNPEIANRPPSAGLWEGQTDEGDLGMSYKDIDRCLHAIESGEEINYTLIDPAIFSRVSGLIMRNAHKILPLPIFTL